MNRITSKLVALVRSDEAPPRTADGERVYAVGDVHGRLDLFGRLIKQLECDSQARAPCSTLIVFVGDLIDRGPDTRPLLELAKRIQRESANRVVILRGNHEDMMLRSAEGNAAAQQLWLKNGGDATLCSYDLDPIDFMALTPDERGAALCRAVGLDMLGWLGTLPLTFRSGDYFFCHAGIRPGVPLNKQRQQDLLWVRGEFLRSSRHHGAVIVHGHTETDHVEVRKNRINIDTAAYRSGELTAVGLQGPLRWFISSAETYLKRSDLAAASAWAAKSGTRP